MPDKFHPESAIMGKIRLEISFINEILRSIERIL